MAAESNVMILDAEDPSLILLTGEWQQVQDNRSMAVTSSTTGSALSMEFFGTELILRSKGDGVLNVQVNGSYLGEVTIDDTVEYQQVLVVSGLDNTYHPIELTLQTGTITIDKVIMGSSTEIPELKLNIPDDYYTRASFNRPWIFQDLSGMYWITMEVQSLSQHGDIYVTNSVDGRSWSRPVPVVTGELHEYDSATVIDENGEFWMVFTRMEPVGGKMVNAPYYSHSKDGTRWDDPQKIQVPQDNVYYPYLYYETETDSFIYLYASGKVEEGEYRDNIYITRSAGLDDLGQPLRITDNSMRSSYYPTLIQDDDGEFWLYFVSPKFEDESVFRNHNDIFVMRSSDLINWSTPSLVTDGNLTVAYNYLHPAYNNGIYYLSIMSSQVLTEDAYIMHSDDGITFSRPLRMIEHDDGNIIDYKSMISDQDGVLWMAYSHVMDDGTRAVYIVRSSDGVIWEAPTRVSPDSNIEGEFWLASEPKPENVLELSSNESAGLSGPGQNARYGEKNGFNTVLFVFVSLLFIMMLKRNR